MEDNFFQIAVIGGGAAGCLAAIAAAQAGCSVLLLEKNDRLARKIYATGNGRCNLTNLFMDPSCYHTGENDRDIPRVLSVLERFSSADLIRFFETLGVPVHDRGGYVYPRTDQAETVAKALELKIRELGIRVRLQSEVKQIRYQKNSQGKRSRENEFHGTGALEKEPFKKDLGTVDGFFELQIETVKSLHQAASGGKTPVRVKGNSDPSGKKGKKTVSSEKKETLVNMTHSVRCGKVILCTGGLAGPSFGCSGDGYRLAGVFSHQIISPLPALTPLVCSCPHLKRADGARCHAGIMLTDAAGTPVPGAAEEGELQITEYGLSGIPAMQLGSIASRRLESGFRTMAVIDFLPEFSDEKFHEEVKRRLSQDRARTLGDLFLGLVHKKVLDLVFAVYGQQAEMKVRRFSDAELLQMMQALRSFSMEITGVRPFSHAQVTAGGIPLQEVDDGFQSCLRPGLYFAGELLDVDGKCGGYNLQWAMSSGWLAGQAAVAAISKGI